MREEGEDVAKEKEEGVTRKGKEVLGKKEMKKEEKEREEEARGEGRREKTGCDGRSLSMVFEKSFEISRKSLSNFVNFLVFKTIPTL